MQNMFNDISGFMFTWDDMCQAVGKLKTDKAFAGQFKSEHLLHGSPKLIVHLQILYNALLQHCYVPVDLLHGTMTPII